MESTPTCNACSSALEECDIFGLCSACLFAQALEEDPPLDSEIMEAAAAAELPRLGRYEDLGIIGTGGMGEVHRVRDLELHRVMAMKIARLEVTNHPILLPRFIEEAQATSQLQHPGIVPVYELGKLPDGRHYYTMKEVRGRTFEAVIQDVHQAATVDGWTAAPSGWTFRRLIDAFFRVCEAMAYAHERKVVHRDLKPANLMVGEHGEVMVMDWGLAKVQGTPYRALEEGDLQPILTVRVGQSMLATRAGSVSGTPAYMSPEQARGDVWRIHASSDVYSLGAVLYTILSGHPPYEGSTGTDVLRRVLEGPPRTLRAQREGGRHSSLHLERLSNAEAGQSFVQHADCLDLLIPEELVAICQKAMSREPGERYPTAKELATDVSRWLDGDQRREQAIAVVVSVQPLPTEVEALRTHSTKLREQANQYLAGIPSYESEEMKRPGWDLEDEAAALERQADMKELEYLQGLQGALTHDSDLAEAHAGLASLYHRQHQEAEAARDSRAAARSEVLLKSYDRRGEYSTYLKGDGAVSLRTDPSGAEVTLYRYEVVNRRLVPKYLQGLGKTPLSKVTLPRGSYLLKLNAPGHAEVLYPVYIGRSEHWDGVPPEGGDILPIWLPPAGLLGTEDCYVPAGWFWAGGDPEAFRSLARQRVWVDGFVMRRFPVTNREYLEFLNDLLVQGREDEALRHAPREPRGTDGEEGALLYGRDEAGRFLLTEDADGDLWEQEFPVLYVDWICAMAYSVWLAERTGRSWRLPGELEWEKAARGVDGRFYPWGDGWNASWVCARECHRGRRMPTGVGSFPIDASVYGIRDLGGNAQEWCVDEFRELGPPIKSGYYEVPAPDDWLIRRLISNVQDSSAYQCRRRELNQFTRDKFLRGFNCSTRGADWNSSDRQVRSANRWLNPYGHRYSFFGFRVASATP